MYTDYVSLGLQMSYLGLSVVHTNVSVNMLTGYGYIILRRLLNS